MKLILAVIQRSDVDRLLEALLKEGFRATLVCSSGGFLRRGNATVMTGVEDHQVDRVLELIRENCRLRRETVRPWPPTPDAGDFFLAPTLEVEVGGATVFVLNVERAERF